MKATFVVEKGTLDHQGGTIMIDGVKFDDVVPLLLNYEQVIGEAKIFIEDGILKAEADVDDKYLDLYPAVGVRILKQTIDKKILKCELKYVGLCGSNNSDISIKSIREQQCGIQ